MYIHNTRLTTALRNETNGLQPQQDGYAVAVDSDPGLEWRPMPKLYEYLGIIVFFYSNEHEPVHVHGRYGECESRIEIIVKGGIVRGIRIQNVRGKRPLPAKQSKQFKKLVQILGDEIVQSWVNYFVYHKKILAKKIVGKL